MPYQSVTLAMLKTRLAERYESSAFWTAEEARLVINEALRVWQLLTAYWKTQLSVSTPAASPWVTIPNTAFLPLRVQWGATGKSLLQGSLASFDYGRSTWEHETTATAGLPSTPTDWAPAGARLIAIWPADNAGGNTLLVDVAATTPVLVADGDFIDISGAELNAILGFALHLLAFKEGGTRFAATIVHRVAFYNQAAELNSRLRASAFFKKFLTLDRHRYEVPFQWPPASGEAAPAQAPQSGQG